MNREEIDRELQRLAASFTEMLREARGEQSSSVELRPILDALMTKEEKDAWKKNETDFTKRNVTPLDKNTHQTRRYQNPLLPTKKARWILR